MAIDYGTVRIGIALSDPLRMIAKPFSVIENMGLDDLIAKINVLIRENMVGQVVLGMPYALNGQETAKTLETKAFMQELQKQIDIPLLAWNESLSTDGANSELKRLGINWKDARKVIDAMAACMILKSYMENIRS